MFESTTNEFKTIRGKASAALLLQLRKAVRSGWFLTTGPYWDGHLWNFSLTNNFLLNREYELVHENKVAAMKEEGWFPCGASFRLLGYQRVPMTKVRL